MMWIYSIIILIIAGLVIYWLKARKQSGGGSPSTIDMSGLSENGSQPSGLEPSMPESSMPETPAAPEMPEAPEASVEMPEMPAEMGGGDTSGEEKPM
jgi:hypothetical protein